MMTENLLMLWEEGRTRFTKLLDVVAEDDLPKKLSPSPNSIGFLIRHIGDVEMLFAKNVFQLKEIQVHAKTVIAQKDTGEWITLAELKEYVHQSATVLRKAILQVKEESWEQSITTKEFGTKTMAEALGRIVTHTAYHAGQLGIILKYGQ
ncbi:DinB family protein [Panacibacter ginsenosidivorans]|uniref:DinB family protein n=1 Tax=Panacibacter ginsenosidivorans TaxID=1813871 RepID=A0A5B8VAT2_9BACT|nr:DinB family protein [Panacibacter ginsenosidivorans]QEC68073.1 DinB family protein [Panacibacter ginsenosidivorans]